MNEHTAHFLADLNSHKESLMALRSASGRFSIWLDMETSGLEHRPFPLTSAKASSERSLIQEEMENTNLTMALSAFNDAMVHLDICIDQIDTTWKKVADTRKAKDRHLTIKSLFDMDSKASSLFGGLPEEMEPDSTTLLVSSAPASPISSRHATESRATLDTPLPTLSSLFHKRLQRSETSDLRDLIDTYCKKYQCTQSLNLTSAGTIVLRGPSDAKPPAGAIHVEIVKLMDMVEERVRKHVSWTDASEHELDYIREGVERILMGRCFDAAMSPLRLQLAKKDEVMRARTRALKSFLTPELLGLVPSLINETVVDLAATALRELDAALAPVDKVACIVECSKLLFSTMKLLPKEKYSGDKELHGADEFMPIFIYVVLRANVPRIYSNLEFISQYRDPTALMGRDGWCYTTLCGAVHYISVLDAPMLVDMDSEEFHAKLDAAMSTERQHSVARREPSLPAWLL